MILMKFGVRRSPSPELVDPSAVFRMWKSCPHQQWDLPLLCFSSSENDLIGSSHSLGLVSAGSLPEISGLVCDQLCRKPGLTENPVLP